MNPERSSDIVHMYLKENKVKQFRTRQVKDDTGLTMAQVGKAVSQLRLRKIVAELESDGKSRIYIYVGEKDD